jgi:type I restriction enzyme R subunit
LSFLACSRRHLARTGSFAELLERSIRAQRNSAVEIAQVIKGLIAITKKLRAVPRLGDALNLTPDEAVFREALDVNESVVKVLGDDALCMIARELVATVRSNVAIDWRLKERVRAKLRVLVKRILRKYRYPPDKQEQATATVLQQA